MAKARCFTRKIIFNNKQMIFHVTSHSRVLAHAIYETVVANYMKRILTLLLISLSMISYAQDKELNDYISAHFDDIGFTLQIARATPKTSFFREGYKVRIACSFKINENGDCEDISVRSQHPNYEIIVKNHLKALELPKELITEEVVSKELYSVPIYYEVLSDNEINKLAKKKARLDKKNKG